MVSVFIKNFNEVAFVTIILSKKVQNALKLSNDLLCKIFLWKYNLQWYLEKYILSGSAKIQHKFNESSPNFASSGFKRINLSSSRNYQKTEVGIGVN